MSLKLISNVGTSNLVGVGFVSLEDNQIHVTIEPFCKAFITRDGKTIQLLESNEVQKSTSGVCKQGDTYSLERGLEKLIIKVEEDKDIYLKNSSLNTSSQNKTLTVGTILLVLLLIAVIFGVKQKNAKDFNLKAEEKLNIAISDYNLLTKESFLKAKKTAEELKNDGYKNDKLDKLISDINSNEETILGSKRVEVKEFLDLSLQTSGFSGKQLSASGDNLFIIDEKNSNVIQVGIKNKSAKIVARSDALKDIKQIGSYDTRLFVDNNDGISEIKSGTIINKIPKDWNSMFYYLYSGNIYLLDITANQIYRYSGEATGFSNKSEWLAPGIEMDFSKIIDMTIDGSIWVLSSSGKVTKFTNGNPNNIAITGIDENLTNPTAIYTNEDLKYVYILDKNNGRVIVLEKNGNFKIQYEADGIKNATDLVVSETEGKVILLTGSKLMFIQI